MKIQVRFNLGFRAIVASIHNCDSLAQGGEMPIVDACGNQSGDFRLQIQRTAGSAERFPR